MSQISETIYDVDGDYDPDHCLYVQSDDAGKLVLTGLDGEFQARVTIDKAGAKKLSSVRHDAGGQDGHRVLTKGYR